MSEQKQERSLNRCEFIGRLGKDAETKFTPSGVAKTSFSIATSHSYKVGEEWKSDTTWTNVVLWRSERVAEYLKKGERVFLAGRLSTRSYDKDGVTKWITEVVADEVMLLGGKSGTAQTAAEPDGW
jgi:single-strand DNA-binding protein